MKAMRAKQKVPELWLCFYFFFQFSLNASDFDKLYKYSFFCRLCFQIHRWQFSWNIWTIFFIPAIIRFWRISHWSQEQFDWKRKLCFNFESVAHSFYSSMLDVHSWLFGVHLNTRLTEDTLHSTISLFVILYRYNIYTASLTFARHPHWSANIAKISFSRVALQPIQNASRWIYMHISFIRTGWRNEEKQKKN